MQTPNKTLIDLETKFWQSIVDNDSDAAAELLTEPALMVSTHGAIRFDHAGYRKMAEQGTMVLTSFELSNMEVVFPSETTALLSYHVKQGVAPRGKGKSTVQEMNDTSTWILTGKRWQCAMHTETPAEAKHSAH
jgi:ketosteroid isomerase-like protein